MSRFSILLNQPKKKSEEHTKKPEPPPETKNEETPKPRNPENLISGNPEIMKSGKPETLKSRKPDSQHAGRVFQKFSTQLEIDSILTIKRIALEEHRKDYDVFQEAVDAYLKSKKR